MRVLAIDPGTTESAWVVWEEGKIVAKGFEKNDALLFCINHGSFSTCNHLAIEWVESMGMAVGKEVFETVFWIGRFWQAWSPVNAHRITRRQVKLHLCGNMNAKDANIRQALIDKIGPVGTKKNPGPCFGVSSHLWSALAVAITFCETEGR